MSSCITAPPPRRIPFLPPTTVFSRLLKPPRGSQYRKRQQSFSGSCHREASSSPWVTVRLVENQVSSLAWGLSLSILDLMMDHWRWGRPLRRCPKRHQAHLEVPDWCVHTRFSRNLPSITHPLLLSGVPPSTWRHLFSMKHCSWQRRSTRVRFCTQPNVVRSCGVWALSGGVPGVLNSSSESLKSSTKQGQIYKERNILLLENWIMRKI